MHFARIFGLLAALALIAAAGRNARAADVHEVASFRGTANGRVVLGPVNLDAGLVVIKARHAGNANFIVGLIMPTPGVEITHSYDDGYGMINVVGQYNGGAATSVRRGGEYVLQVEASGSYQITLEQAVEPLARDADLREFTGRGQQVTPAFALPTGPVTLRMTHDGRSNFQVWLYDLGGATVGGDTFGRLVNAIGPADEAVTLEIVIDGPHLIYVNADGNWTVTIAE